MNFTKKKDPKKVVVSTEKTTVRLFLFQKENYKWLLISIGLVFFGFALMSGSSDINSFRKIVLAPIVVLLGFGLGFYAIFKNTSEA